MGISCVQISLRQGRGSTEVCLVHGDMRGQQRLRHDMPC